MNREQLTALLVGKTIKSVQFNERYPWPIFIDSLTLSDETTVHLYGSGDEAGIDMVTWPNGDEQFVRGGGE